MNEHRYRIVEVPSGCTDYNEGDYLTFPVPEPPPQQIVFEDFGDCSGIRMVLDDPA